MNSEFGDASRFDLLADTIRVLIGQLYAPAMAQQQDRAKSRSPTRISGRLNNGSTGYGAFLSPRMQPARNIE